MYYVENTNHDPAYNLAVEEYLLRQCPENDFFCLWRNKPTIVVGKYQNTRAEIDTGMVQERGICVVRRISGGGAVYHDLGNVNYTFISNATTRPFSFEHFARPVIQALAKMGVQAAFSGRNDLTIDGRKISGNAQYRIGQRTLHHGTLMFDTNLDVLRWALKGGRKAGKEALRQEATKGVPSVRSRITNIRDYLPGSGTVEEFLELLQHSVREDLDIGDVFDLRSRAAPIQELARSKYETDAWTYGVSPRYNVRRERYIEGCGTLQAFLDVQEERLAAVALFGDFFGESDVQGLEEKLNGATYRREVLAEILQTIDIGPYVHNVSAEDFLDLLIAF